MKNDDDHMRQHEAELRRLNDTYLARARNILSEDQLAALQRYLDLQAQMGLASLKMSAQMFAPKTAPKP